MKKNKILALLICLFVIFLITNIYADTIPGNGNHSVAAQQTQPVPHKAGGIWDFPNFHPLVVHFPIVLLVFAAFLQILYFWKKDLNNAVLILLFCGTAGAWLAAEIFDAHPNFNMLSPEAKDIFRHHHQFADYTTWLSTVALALKIIGYFITRRKMIFEVLVLVVLTASAVTVCVSGHYGSYLVHIEGVGPQGHLLKESDTD